MGTDFFSQFTVDERRFFRKLSTPRKIQDFLVSLPMNFAETMMSPRRVLREGKAHCLEGALLAAAALWFHGAKPLLLDLEASSDDESHVVALFRRFGCWGAISHTNHAVLRFREPIYKTLRELTLSYFHEYFLNSNGKKTLRSHSRPVDLSLAPLVTSPSLRGRRGEGDCQWLTAEEDAWYIEKALEDARHYSILTPAMARNLRPADEIEIKAGEIVAWRLKE